MAAAPKLKLAEKQEIYKKLFTSLKKRYSGAPKPPDLPVLETMLFAVCLENATVKEADAAFKRLLAAFHDLNEIRVSSIDELEVVFQGMSDPDWRASRIRGILGYVFETNYSFEFEGLKRKTLELATKQLSKIKELTPFVRDYTLHAALGAHLIPLDATQLAAIDFLDLHAEQDGADHTAESLRPLVRKAEGTEFSILLKEFSLDPKLRTQFGIVKQSPPLEGATLPPPLVRLDRLLKGESIKWEGGQAKKTAAADKKSTDKKAAAPAGSKKPTPVAAQKSKHATAKSPVKPVKPAAKSTTKASSGKSDAKRAAPKAPPKPAAKASPKDKSKKSAKSGK